MAEVPYTSTAPLNLPEAVKFDFSPSADLQIHKALSRLGSYVSGSVHDTALYCRKLLVRFRHHDLAHDMLRLMTITIWVKTSGSSKTKESSVCVRLHDDFDPNLLLEVNLTSENFNEFKEEQRLLVNFTSFPTMLIELLERCGDPSPTACSRGSSNAFSSSESGEESENLSPICISPERKSPSLARGERRSTVQTTQSASNVALLAAINETPGQLKTHDRHTSMMTSLIYKECLPGDFKKHKAQVLVTRATLCLIEVNDYKELTHLYLNLVQVEDKVLRHHIFTRLSQCRTYMKHLEGDYKKLMRNRLNLVSAYSRLEMELKNHKDQLAAVKKDAAAEFEAQLSETEARFKAEIAQLTQTLTTIQQKHLSDRAQLAQEIEGLQAQIRSLKEQLAAAESEKSHLKMQLHQVACVLGSEYTEGTDQSVQGMDPHQIGQRLLQLQSDYKQAKVRVASLETSLKASMEARRVAEGNLEMYKKKEATLKESLIASSQEIVKGNELIEQLQSALTSCRQKMKENKTQLSTLVKNRSLDLEQMSELRSKVLDLENEIITLRNSEEKLKSDNASLQTKVCQYEEVVKAKDATIQQLDIQLNQKIIESITSSSSLMDGFNMPAPLMCSSPPITQEGLSPFHQSSLSSAYPMFPPQSLFPSKNPNNCFAGTKPWASHQDLLASDSSGGGPQTAPKPTTLKPTYCDDLPSDPPSLHRPQPARDYMAGSSAADYTPHSLDVSFGVGQNSLEASAPVSHPKRKNPFNGRYPALLSPRQPSR